MHSSEGRMRCYDNTWRLTTPRVLVPRLFISSISTAKKRHFEKKRKKLVLPNNNIVFKGHFKLKM